MIYAPGPHLSAKDAATHAFAKCDKLEAINADLLAALEKVLAATTLVDIIAILPEARTAIAKARGE